LPPAVTLGILIPPSTGFIIYALLTEESIGRLFLAGLLPGLMLTVQVLIVT
jgi:TRAP-type C4-dicarboxylate transport system permease large subunit